MREVILRQLQQKPFVPFRITLTGGHVHEVRQPELCRLTPSTLRIGRHDRSATPPAVVDHYIIALDHVVSLEPLIADEPVVVEPATRP